jgi:hypothetical protein
MRSMRGNVLQAARAQRRTGTLDGRTAAELS